MQLSGVAESGQFFLRFRCSSAANQRQNGFALACGDLLFLLIPCSWPQSYLNAAIGSMRLARLPGRSFLLNAPFSGSEFGLEPRPMAKGQGLALFLQILPVAAVGCAGLVLGTVLQFHHRMNLPIVHPVQVVAERVF
jgi:hypothetical protein